MGWVHNRFMQRGHGLNANPKKNGSNNGPLRKIVCHVSASEVMPIEYTEVTVNVLECGHWISKAVDLFGERSPMRRRCPECRDGKPPRWKKEQVEAWAKEMEKKNGKTQI